MIAPLIWLLVTILLFAVSDYLYSRHGGRVWLHPILLPTTVLMIVFAVFPSQVRAYEAGTNILYAGLLAAVAALAVPLYRNRAVLRRERGAVCAGIVAGSLSGVATAVAALCLMAPGGKLMGAVVTKSVTTPIAISVAGSIGAPASLAAAIVIVTGLVAAIFGPPLLRRLGVDDDVCMGLALGTAGHAIGMAEAVRQSDLMGATAAFAMAANGLMTALVVPALWHLVA